MGIEYRSPPSIYSTLPGARWSGGTSVGTSSGATLGSSLGTGTQWAVWVDLGTGSPTRTGGIWEGR